MFTLATLARVYSSWKWKETLEFSLPTAPSVHWWGTLHVRVWPTNSAPWLQVVTGLAADVTNLTGKILSVG